MSKDWRLEILETSPYLRGVHFVRKAYCVRRPDWDHDHCVACSAKLMAPGSTVPGVEHEGYATTAAFVHGADYDWACVTCFALFGEAMGWVDDTRGFAN